jgi:hypothetical protein
MDDVDLILDVWAYRKLKEIEKRLYAEKPLSGDERRDLANTMNAVLQRVIAMAHGNG